MTSDAEDDSMNKKRTSQIERIHPRIRSGEQFLYARQPGNVVATHIKPIVVQWNFHPKDGDRGALAAWLTANERQLSDAADQFAADVVYEGTYLCVVHAGASTGNILTIWSFESEADVRAFEDELAVGASNFAVLLRQFIQFIERDDSLRPVHISRYEPAHLVAPL